MKSRPHRYMPTLAAHSSSLSTELYQNMLLCSHSRSPRQQPSDAEECQCMHVPLIGRTASSTAATRGQAGTNLIYVSTTAGQSHVHKHSSHNLYVSPHVSTRWCCCASDSASWILPDSSCCLRAT